MRHATPIAAGLAAMLASGLGTAEAQDATAPAAGVTAGRLAELCAAGGGADIVSAAAVGYCRGFMISAGQYHAELATRGGRPPVFCLPEPSPTIEAAQASYVAWAQANPQYAGDKALIGLMRWTADAYPCAPATSARRAPAAGRR